MNLYEYIEDMHVWWYFVSDLALGCITSGFSAQGERSGFSINTGGSTD